MRARIRANNSPKENGLDNVVVRTVVQSADFVGFGVAGGDNKNGGGYFPATHFAADGVAVRSGQAQVKQHQVKRAAARPRNGPCSVSHHLGIVPRLADGLVQQGGDAGVIFHNQDVHITVSECAYCRFRWCSGLSL